MTCIKVIIVGSDHLRQPNFSKGLTKLAIILDYKHPWMNCLDFQPGQKSGMILPFEVVLKLKLQKNNFNKKCAPKTLFLKDKKNQKVSDDF